LGRTANWSTHVWNPEKDDKTNGKKPQGKKKTFRDNEFYWWRKKKAILLQSIFESLKLIGSFDFVVKTYDMANQTNAVS